VKRETDRDAVLQDLRTFVEIETPWSVVGEMESPIEGERGNVEVLLHIRPKHSSS